MSTVNDIIGQIEQLSPEDQDLLWNEISHKFLARKFRERGNQPEKPLPISDVELDQIVHEARQEVLRARGL